MARSHYKKGHDKKTTQGYEPAYYKGLNFLLNEQPDKAIDVFINLLEVDSETVETHLALGSLFRKRGEVDRAIRIHQNLIARPSLDQEQRANALLELGQDYMNAGLFDRAENLFTELYETGKLQKQALQNLKEIYQQEKVWEKCLSVVRQLENYTGKSYSEEIAHYHCELAEQALKSGDKNKAADLLKKARQSGLTSIRPLLIEARMEVDQQNFRKALALYRQAIDADPLFLPELLADLVHCFRQADAGRELTEYLGKLYQDTHNTTVLEQISNLLASSQGSKAAVDHILSELQKYPSLAGIKLLTKWQGDLQGQHSPGVINVLLDTVDAELAKRPAYCCRRCGYQAKTLHWQCPGCRSWGTIKPAQEETSS